MKSRTRQPGPARQKKDWDSTEKNPIIPADITLLVSLSETETNKNPQLCGEKKIAGTESCWAEANALSSAWCNQLSLAGQHTRRVPPTSSPASYNFTSDLELSTPAGQQYNYSTISYLPHSQPLCKHFLFQLMNNQIRSEMIKIYNFELIYRL